MNFDMFHDFPIASPLFPTAFPTDSPQRQVELHVLGGSQLLTLLLSLGASGAIAWGGALRMEFPKHLVLYGNFMVN